MDSTFLQKLIISTNKKTTPFVKLSRIVDPEKLGILSEQLISGLAKAEVSEGTCDFCGTNGSVQGKFLANGVAALLGYPESSKPSWFCLLCKVRLQKATELQSTLFSVDSELDAIFSGLTTVLRIRQSQKGKDIVHKTCPDLKRCSRTSNSDADENASDTQQRTFLDYNPDEALVREDEKGQQDGLVSYIELGDVEVVKQETEECETQVARDEAADSEAISDVEYQLFRKSEIKKKKDYSCKICGRPFPKKSKLTRHLATHANDKSPTVLECCFCRKVFQSRWALNQHFEIHKVKDNPNKCGLCGKILFSFETLQNHHINKHGTQEQKDARKPKSERPKPVANAQTCSYCERSFRMKGTLKRHLKTHASKESPPITHECEFCLKKFSHLWGWKQHIYSHADKDNPGKCQICGKVLMQFKSLRKHHVGVHGTQEQKDAYRLKWKNHESCFPRKCKVCFKTFSSLQTLNQHHISKHGSEEEKNALRSKRRNMVEKQKQRKSPLKCYFCGRIYYFWGKLRVHFQQHTKERCYKCTICDKRMLYWGQLYQHYFSKHGRK